MEEEEPKPPTKGKAFYELVEELQKADVPRRNKVYPAASSAFGNTSISPMMDVNDEDGREVIRFVPIK